MQSKVIVIGLDGATFKIIEPLLAQNALPGIGKLVKNGTKATLLSTIPPATIPAWPSFMTGMNPGKHGVFDFFKYDKGRNRIITGDDICAKTIWEVLSDFGKRSIVMNVPATYPLKKINGIIVSGLLTPEGEEFISPPAEREFIDSAADGYRINENICLLSDKEILSDLYLVTQKQRKAFLALLQQKEWDFAMIMFRGTDVAQHLFWEQQEIIKQFYRFVDSTAEELIDIFPDAMIVVISDHGFQSQEKDFHINKWLVDNGFMSIKRGGKDKLQIYQEIEKLSGRKGFILRTMPRLQCLGKFCRCLGINRDKIENFLSGIGIKWAKMNIPDWIRRLVASKDYQIDWSHTKAATSQFWTPESKAISINVKEKFMQGTVESHEYENIRKKILEQLCRLEDPETNKPIVKKIWLKEELYWGPCLEEAPDMILELQNGYNITDIFTAESYVSKRKNLKGCHHREGILVIAGKDIKKEQILAEKNILLWDLAPTILHYLNIPIPQDCDGRVLLELFDENSDVKKRKIQKIQMNVSKPKQGPYISKAQQEQIKERLRALGYI